MKKLFIGVLFLFVVLQQIIAGVIDPSVAKTLAVNFYKNVSNGQIAVMTLAYEGYTQLSTGETVSSYYVFNAENDKGFVIVSADDNAIPVWGYSTTNPFVKTSDWENSNMAKWLKNNESQMREIIENKIPADLQIRARWTQLLKGESDVQTRTGTVNPLVVTTWNQSKYYNALCPADVKSPNGYDGKVPTGCVATAMAQIMKYWNSPSVGSGSHSYTSTLYGVQSANFGATTYDWANMPNNVTSYNTPVATLMYHCGVSVDMGYGPTGSGAYVTAYPGYATAESALKTFFNYNVKGIIRSNFQTANWIALLKTEMDASRPVIYTGDDPKVGGHCFVCDGYDANSFFHFNWGWGGYNNGFFSVDALNTSVGKWNSGQSALINISPATPQPSVTLTSPINNANYVAPASITLSATASENGGTITKVEFYNGSTLLSTSSTSPYNYTWSNVGLGTYTITAKAYDATSKSIISTPSTITVSTLKPTVTLTSPTNNATFTPPASITISATATETGGTVKKVEFYNGTNLLATLTTTPYTYTWTGVTAGTYSITAKATDAAGNSSTSAVSSITVQTPGSCVTPTGLTVTNLTAKGGTWSWTAVTGAVQYLIEYQIKGSTTWSTLGTFSSRYTAVNVTMPASLCVSFRVTSICASAKSSASTAYSFCTPVASSNIIYGASAGNNLGEDASISLGSEVKLYPNPVNSELALEYNYESSESTEAHIKVYDFIGRQLCEQFETVTLGTNIHFVKTEHLTNGSYLVQLIIGDKTVVTKQFQVFR